MAQQNRIEQHVVMGRGLGKLSSPLYLEGNAYCVSQTSGILKFNSTTDKLETLFNILGQPSAIAYIEGSKHFLIADLAHQLIFERPLAAEDVTNLVSEYKGRAFVGPQSLRIGSYSKNLYFTDSGPFQETSIECPHGSVFVYNFDSSELHCLSYHNLAFPSDLECDEEEKFLLVCEMGENRIISFPLDENYSGNRSVFYQFSGRQGPSCISSCEGVFYVGLFEFDSLSSHCLVAVLNPLGELLERLKLPIGPQITGLYSMQFNHQVSIYLTEGSQLHKFTLKSEHSESKMDESIVLAKDK